MNKHTPGPWNVQQDNVRVGDPWTGVYSDAAGADLKMPAVCYGPDQEANAHLIAAAPDLLEAAQGSLSILFDIRNHEDWEMCAVAESVEGLRAAIEKATR